MPAYILFHTTTSWYNQLGGEDMARPKKPQGEKHEKVSISFDPDQLALLEKYCQKEERSMAWVVRKALAEWLPKHMGEGE